MTIISDNETISSKIYETWNIIPLKKGDNWINIWNINRKI